MVRKYSFAALLLVLTVSSLASCGTRTESAAPEADTTRYELTGEATIEKDEELTLPTEEIDFSGSHYVVNVHRAPADSLPSVKDSFGDPYLDNQVDVSVTVNGSQLIRRTITKSDFASAASGVDLQKVVLGGMTFSSINSSGIHFNAQLNSPGSVEGGHNFRLTFPLAGGGVQITADNSAEDMSSYTD